MTLASTDVVFLIGLGTLIGIVMATVPYAWQDLRARRKPKPPPLDRERELRRVAVDLNRLAARMDALVTPEAAAAAEAAAATPAPDRARATA